MIRPTVARVDLTALQSNYRRIVEHLTRGRAPRAPGVIAVVKANAYGHGAPQVARALEDAGADLLACADIEEGHALRAAGVRAEILVFGALSVSDLDGLFEDRKEGKAREEREARKEGAPYVHAANSAALLRDPRVWYDRVRPGLLLYGIVPPPLASAIPLTPIMTLGSRIVAVKGVRAGEGVGYGVKFHAGRPTTIAIVPAGDADRLDLPLAGGGAVLVRGPPAPVVGTVCMDMPKADRTRLHRSPGDAARI